MGIYVETRIRGTLDELWDRTQRPDLHQRWDARFSAITYLPRPDATQPQRFTYETRIGFGLAIRGIGETIGTRAANGQRTSALKFWSDDPKSLISVGSGYWKYIPDGDGVRFLTWYDYQTRFGMLGRLFDRAVFRPLMAWATAWSFDRLRLWIERGVTPEAALRRSVLHSATRACCVFLAGGVLARRLHRRPLLAALLTLLALLGALAWPPPADLPAARRCRRRPLPRPERLAHN